eukprot:s592_g6.t1
MGQVGFPHKFAHPFWGLGYVWVIILTGCHGPYPEEFRNLLTLIWIRSERAAGETCHFLEKTQQLWEGTDPSLSTITLTENLQEHPIPEGRTMVFCGCSLRQIH